MHSFSHYSWICISFLYACVCTFVCVCAKKNLAFNLSAYNHSISGRSISINVLKIIKFSNHQTHTKKTVSLFFLICNFICASLFLLFALSVKCVCAHYFNAKAHGHDNRFDNSFSVHLVFVTTRCCCRCWAIDALITELMCYGIGMFALKMYFFFYIKSKDKVVWLKLCTLIN